MSGVLRDAGLSSLGVEHGFGLRGVAGPEGLELPHQTHGTGVHTVVRPGDADGVDADVIVSRLAGTAVGVVTADCVPILLASPDGRGVAAIHAGWRGLCAGVVEAGVRALGEPPAVAAIGPHIGACCYEVDEPVLSAVQGRFGPNPPAGAVRAGRAGHAWLDLGSLAEEALRRAGASEAAIGRQAAACTSCDSGRFHSYRRDGPRSGRLVHFVRCPLAPSEGLASRP